jgi:hypothetical protein
MKEALKQIVDLLQPVAALADGTPFEHSEVIQRCVDALEIALEALAQPAQEPDHGDELTIAYMSGVHRGKELAAQPAQEPVSVTYKEVADAMNSLWNGTLEQHQIAQQMANKKLYTTPAQPAQEPVAWMDIDEKGSASGLRYWSEPDNRHEVALYMLKENT